MILRKHRYPSHSSKPLSPRAGAIYDMHKMLDIPIKDFVHAISELEVFTKVAVSGHGYARIREGVLKFLRESEDELKNPVSYEERQQEAKVLNDFAEEQLKSGFPYLLSLATVRLWSILEAAVYRVLTENIKDPERLKTFDSFSKLKGPLVAFLGASDDERIEILLGQLNQDISGPLKPGVGKLESLLGAVGLGGAVPDEIRRKLLELSEVRNVIVHRNAIADRKFVTRCPWFGAEIGCTVEPQIKHFGSYRLASYWYLMEIERRLIDAGLVEPGDRTLLDKFLADVEISLKDPSA